VPTPNWWPLDDPTIDKRRKQKKKNSSQIPKQKCYYPVDITASLAGTHVDEEGPRNIAQRITSWIALINQNTSQTQDTQAEQKEDRTTRFYIISSSSR